MKARSFALRVCAPLAFAAAAWVSGTGAHATPPSAPEQDAEIAPAVGLDATIPAEPGAAPEAAPPRPALREGEALDARAPADTVVAVIGDRQVTLAEVDALIPAEARRTAGDSPIGLHQVRAEVLDMLVMEVLLQRVVEDRGLDSIETLVRIEIDDSVPPPSVAETRAYYAENVRKMGGQPFEALRDGLIVMLHERAKREAFANWIARLRKDAGVTARIPEPRVHVEAIGPARGPLEAPVTIVAFLDYECPFCAKVFKSLELVQRSFPTDVRLVIRDLPLPMHPNAEIAAEAARCADEQGQFWALSPQLFGSQGALAAGQVAELARVVPGLDAKVFAGCMEAGRHRDAIRVDVAAAERLGVDGTPTVFVNGRVVSGAVSVGAYRTMVDEEMGRVPLILAKPLADPAAPPAADPAAPGGVVPVSTPEPAEPMKTPEAAAPAQPLPVAETAGE